MDTRRKIVRATPPRPIKKGKKRKEKFKRKKSKRVDPFGNCFPWEQDQLERKWSPRQSNGPDFRGPGTKERFIPPRKTQGTGAEIHRQKAGSYLSGGKRRDECRRGGEGAKEL